MYYKMSPLHVYILPVSGGYFPLQLAGLSWMEGAPTPDLVLGTSGGNTSAYIAMAGGWTADGIQRTIAAANLNSGLFVRSWWPEHLFYIPSILKGYFKGSAYRTTPYITQTFEALYGENKEQIVSTEVWTGVYNATQGASQFFCNRSSASALLHPTEVSVAPYNVAPSIYADGDIPLIASASLASASVPAVLTPQYIQGSLYYDGGMTYSSPLTALHTSLKPYVGARGAHLTYFSPYDTSSPAFPDLYEYEYQGNVPGTMYTNGFNAVKELYKSLMISDIMTGVSMLGDTTFTNHVMTRDEFQAYQRQRRSMRSSFVEVYPLVTTRMSYTSFTASDITDAMASVTQVGVRAWTSGN